MTTTQTPIEAATDIVQKFYRAGQDDGFAPADMATASADGFRAGHESNFSAADMATAKAEGFREGAAEMAKLRGQRMVLCSLLCECRPVIEAMLQIPGDDASDAHLNGLLARVGDALVAIAEARVKGGES